MYEAFVTQGPHRQKDGMVHFTVEFRAEGQPVVLRSSFTATFTEEWFRHWCKQQIEVLNAPQEIDAVRSGKVDLTGVVVPEGKGPSDEERQFADDARRFLQLKALAGSGLALPKSLTDELATVQTAIETALAEQPDLSRRYPVRLI